jgi:two-component system chemotaxis response regulator CheB
VVTLDICMPGIDGLGTLRCIMNDSPRPVIIVSAATEKGAETTLNALSAGAFDYVPKNLDPASLDITHIQSDLIAKIRAAGQSRAALSDGRKPPRSVASETSQTPSAAPQVVAIGISTGGPKALEQILPRFPRDFPVPILIVQHMPVGFTAPFAERLNSLSSIRVRQPVQGELVHPATAYIAPAGLHMRILRRTSDSKLKLWLSLQPEDSLHVPSIDILMKSVAEVFQNRALGVIMTGMGSDGAEGISAIFRSGGVTIGQDETTCAVFGMPRVCYELGVLSRMVPLSDIPRQIIEATRRRKQA